MVIAIAAGNGAGQHHAPLQKVEETFLEIPSVSQKMVTIGCLSLSTRNAWRRGVLPFGMDWASSSMAATSAALGGSAAARTARTRSMVGTEAGVRHAVSSHDAPEPPSACGSSSSTGRSELPRMG